MYVEVSPWTLALFLVPALAAQRLYGLYQEQRQLAADLSTANETLERANLQFAAALIATLDARDRYTAGHSAAVAIYSRDIAERMGLATEMQEHAYLCGLVHDIGKIGLPPGLLEKPARSLSMSGARCRSTQRSASASSRTWTSTRRSRRSSASITSESMVRATRTDSADETIPLVSRIIAVADAYNAMTSAALPRRDAEPSRTLRLAQAVDSQFDTSVVAAFEAILAGADEDYRLRSGKTSLSSRRATYDAGTPSPSIADVA